MVVRARFETRPDILAALSAFGDPQDQPISYSEVSNTSDNLEKSRDSKIRRLFDSREEKLFSLFLMKRLGKLISFWGQMVLRMKLIAKKDLILLFQMTPSRILCDR